MIRKYPHIMLAAFLLIAIIAVPAFAELQQLPAEQPQSMTELPKLDSMLDVNDETDGNEIDVVDVAEGAAQDAESGEVTENNVENSSIEGEEGNAQEQSDVEQIDNNEEDEPDTMPLLLESLSSGISPLQTIQIGPLYDAVAKNAADIWNEEEQYYVYNSGYESIGAFYGGATIHLTFEQTIDRAESELGTIILYPEASPEKSEPGVTVGVTGSNENVVRVVCAADNRHAYIPSGNYTLEIPAQAIHFADGQVWPEGEESVEIKFVNNKTATFSSFITQFPWGIPKPVGTAMMNNGNFMANGMAAQATLPFWVSCSEDDQVKNNFVLRNTATGADMPVASVSLKEDASGFTSEIERLDFPDNLEEGQTYQLFVKAGTPYYYNNTKAVLPDEALIFTFTLAEPVFTIAAHRQYGQNVAGNIDVSSETIKDIPRDPVFTVHSSQPMLEYPNYTYTLGAEFVPLIGEEIISASVYVRGPQQIEITPSRYLRPNTTYKIVLPIELATADFVLLEHALEVPNFTFTTAEVTEEGLLVGFSPDNPILIKTALDFYNIRNESKWESKFYRLENDIDLDELYEKNLDEIESGFLNWVPFPASSGSDAQLGGGFDGNGKTIANLTICKPPQSSQLLKKYASLFGSLSIVGYGEVLIKDLTVTVRKIYLPEYSDIAVFATRPSGRIAFDNCHVTVADDVAKQGLGGRNDKDEDSIITGLSIIGGFVAHTDGGSYRNCSVKDISIYATRINFNANTNMFVGGFVGRSSNSLSFDNCMVDNVKLSVDMTDEALNRGVGGMIGVIERFNGPRPEYNIMNSQVSNSSIAGRRSVGGILGFSNTYLGIHDSAVTNTFIFGKDAVGGFIGTANYSYDYDKATILNCITSAQVGRAVADVREGASFAAFCAQYTPGQNFENCFYIENAALDSEGLTVDNKAIASEVKLALSTGNKTYFINRDEAVVNITTSPKVSFYTPGSIVMQDVTGVSFIEKQDGQYIVKSSMPGTKNLDFEIDGRTYPLNIIFLSSTSNSPSSSGGSGSSPTTSEKEEETTPVDPESELPDESDLIDPETEQPGTTTNDMLFENFTDVTGHWASEAIRYAVTKGFFNGTSTTTFSPDAAVTRGMFVTVLGRMSGVDVTGKTSVFTDVPAGAYYAPYVAFAGENQIVQGIGNGLFDPDAEVTREAIATIMLNFARYLGEDISHIDSTQLDSFQDSGAVSLWAKDALSFAINNGLLRGRDDGSLDPQGIATRAEISVILQRFANAYGL